MDMDRLLRSHDELKLEIDSNLDYWNRDTLYSKQKELVSLKGQIVDASFNIEEAKKGISFNQLKKEVESMPIAPKYATGIHKLDDELKGGIDVGSLVQLASASFMGKSTFVMKILTTIAESNKTVLFNFEMGKRKTVKKLSSFIYTEKQGDNLVVDSHTREIDSLCDEIVIYAKKGVKFFAIDSKMKIEVRSSEAEHLKNAYVTRKLSQTVQENDVIVFLINQISEENLKTGRLSFKGSGDQQYDSDLSLFILPITLENDKIDENKRLLVCNKNRLASERLFSIELYKNDVEKVKCVETQFGTEVDIPMID